MKENHKDARNFVIVFSAVEKNGGRSEGADFEGIHKILLASKGFRVRVKY